MSYHRSVGLYRLKRFFSLGLQLLRAFGRFYGVGFGYGRQVRALASPLKTPKIIAKSLKPEEKLLTEKKSRKVIASALARVAISAFFLSLWIATPHFVRLAMTEIEFYSSKFLSPFVGWILGFWDYFARCAGVSAEIRLDAYHTSERQNSRKRTQKPNP